MRFAAANESVVGTNRTSRAGLMMSVVRSKPEVADKGYPGTQPVRISLQMIPDDARIEGVVHATNSDAPVASALVILVPQDIVNDEPNFRRFQSDSDGTFKFGNVIPGKYTVVAIQNGWNLEWAKPDVLKDYLAKGETIEVAPKARMKVTVKAQ